MIDSDNYFTKPFDPKILFEDGVLKTFSWRLPEERIKYNKSFQIPWFTDNCMSPAIAEKMRSTGGMITSHNLMVLIKDFFGNKNKDFYGFVMAPFVFNSDALDRMKKFIEEKGGYKFSMLIRLMPFEMQWYGEYMLQHELFVPMNGIFTIIESPDHCYEEDGGASAYGVWFQSIVYDYANFQASENSHLIYKKPMHCNKLK